MLMLLAVVGNGRGKRQEQQLLAFWAAELAQELSLNRLSGLWISHRPCTQLGTASLDHSLAGLAASDNAQGFVGVTHRQ